jgi:hypothetical protein
MTEIPVQGADAFRSEMVPADGTGIRTAGSDSVAVTLLDDQEALARTVVLAGCTPMLSLWARSAERWFPSLRVQWRHANSMQALRSLARGEVHAAGIHLSDPATGEHNTPFVREILPGRATVLVNLGVWNEGFVVAPGNPKGVRDVTDLTRRGIALINREAGAGSRLLLDTLLEAAGVPATPEKRHTFHRDRRHINESRPYKRREQINLAVSVRFQPTGLQFGQVSTQVDTQALSLQRRTSVHCTRQKRLRDFYRILIPIGTPEKLVRLVTCAHASLSIVEYRVRCDPTRKTDRAGVLSIVAGGRRWG